MRMWMIDPKLLCRNHLLGEHRELHMLAGSVNKRLTLRGFVKNGLVELDKIGKRHEQLVRELHRRGYNHQSPLSQPKLTYYNNTGKVDEFKSKLDLIDRCSECREKISTVRRPDYMKIATLAKNRKRGDYIYCLSCRGIRFFRYHRLDKIRGPIYKCEVCGMEA